MAKPFFVKDCAQAVLSTGESAASLSEMREVLNHIGPSSLYYHFWGRHFRPAFDHPELHNDFARWSYLSLHDQILSERLGIIDPTDYKDLEELRRVLIDILDQRLDEIEHLFWSTKQNRFHFLKAVTLVFETDIVINHPVELKEYLPKMTKTSIFYHFLDARRRTPAQTDDFSFWLSEAGYGNDDILNKIAHIDPYFLSLTAQKQKLIEIISEYFS